MTTLAIPRHHHAIHDAGASLRVMDFVLLAFMAAALAFMASSDQAKVHADNTSSAELRSAN